MDSKRQVIVTTKHRGVFYGTLIEECREFAILECAKTVVKWVKTKGVFGLAKSGPTDECRIGPEVGRMKLYDITSIVDCSEAAAEQFKKEIWH